MFKKTKILAAVLPLVFACAGAAQAATFYNPVYDDNGPTGDCAASTYSDWNSHVSYFTYFNVPAIANGQTVWVVGSQYQNSYQYFYPNSVQAEFSCENGTLTTSNQWDFDITWAV